MYNIIISRSIVILFEYVLENSYLSRIVSNFYRRYCVRARLYKSYVVDG